MALILASASPRRKEILSRLGVPFTVIAAEVDETPRPGEKPGQAAQRVAKAKAEAVVALGGEGVILAADTVVVLRDQILGKPQNATDAVATLGRLRGRLHRVVTGIYLLRTADGATYRVAVTTKVWMRSYTDAEIAAYVASGEPFDKAGSYAIQSREFHPVERIEGCYLNVVGLPLCEVVRGLVHFGYPLPISVTQALGPPCLLCAERSVAAS